MGLLSLAGAPLSLGRNTSAWKCLRKWEGLWGLVILGHFTSTQLTESVVQDLLHLKLCHVARVQGMVCCARLMSLLMGLNSGVNSRLGKALLIAPIAFSYFSRLSLYP